MPGTLKILQIISALQVYFVRRFSQSSYQDFRVTNVTSILYLVNKGAEITDVEQRGFLHNLIFVINTLLSMTSKFIY